MNRVAIVGTAQSWRQTPFDDPSLHIVSLNDAHMLALPRVDEWYELHPIDKFVFRKPKERVVDGRTIPPGHYVRPDGHVEWLKKQAETIPVWLQQQPPEGWPVNAQRLPIETLQERFGLYWASGPAYMLMHLYLRGYRHFAIYGIHLATEHEYREQRPNFEFLIGRLLGPHVKETREGDMRVYTGADCSIALPLISPILAHGWKYAYDPKPTPPHNPYRDELAMVRQQKAELVKALVHWPTGKDKRDAIDQLEWLEVVELDCQQQLQKASLGGTLAAVTA